MGKMFFFLFKLSILYREGGRFLNTLLNQCFYGYLKSLRLTGSAFLWYNLQIQLRRHPRINLLLKQGQTIHISELIDKYVNRGKQTQIQSTSTLDILSCKNFPI